MTSLKHNFSALAGLLVLLSCCIAKPQETPTDKNAALRTAADRGELSNVLQLIRDGAQINEPNSDGKTALHYAAQCKNVSVVNALIQAGANVNSKMNGNVTPLMLSVDMAFGQPEIAMALIRAGADVSVADKNGDTALIIATTESSDEVIRSLLERGADPNSRGPGGETALHIAASNGMLGRAKLLLDHGADASIRDASRKSPYDLALTTSADPKVQADFQKMKTLLLNSTASDLKNLSVTAHGRQTKKQSSSEPLEPPKIVFLNPHMSLKERKLFLAGDYKIFWKLRDIPAAILVKYTPEESKKVAMADPGEEYQETDALGGGPPLPWRRLIFAGLANNNAFVEYEHGGRGKYIVVDLFNLKSPETAEGVWRGYCIPPAGTLDDLRKQISDGRCK